MNSSSVYEVTAKTDVKIIKSALFLLECKKVGERLCRVEMTAVTGIYYRAVGSKCGCFCRSRFRVSYDKDICLVADAFGCVLEILAF